MTVSVSRPSSGLGRNQGWRFWADTLINEIEGLIVELMESKGIGIFSFTKHMSIMDSHLD